MSKYWGLKSKEIFAKLECNGRTPSQSFFLDGIEGKILLV